MLGVIYDYMASLLLFVFIVWTYESTEHGSVFLIMLLCGHRENYYSEVVSWKFCKLLVWMHILCIMHEASNI